ncbi:methyltransferase domain-containing protein [Azohydromonas sp.]|uniref:SAM-dependent methyltransferase n=1 Tax=Azohydromonas sp. TaxID=1872666 RepID=UPI002CC4E55F|nr:methyltransferase domain-containing protein [Azohydromonas sp.]HMM85826.1 methyltransferase domain-containing protein [Azohydromonas sp.]
MTAVGLRRSTRPPCVPRDDRPAPRPCGAGLDRWHGRGRCHAVVAAALALVALLAPWATAADTDVPFVVTPDRVTLAMLELAGVGPDDHVIDLGSGDGRIVILAAQRFGATGLGVEIVDDLVRRSREHAMRAGVADRVEFRTEDLFDTDLSRATVVTMYLLPAVNLKLRPRLLALAPGTRVVSHDYDLGDWRPDRSVVVDAPDKPVGRDPRSTLHLWTVPARVAGSWCGGGAAAHRLRIDQHHQDIDATLDATPLTGRADGARLRLRPDGDGTEWVLRWLADGTLRVDAPTSLRGARFVRAAAGTCASR